MDDAKRVAVVTGANRGIGLEIGRQLARRGQRVVLTSCDEAKGREATAGLVAEGLDVEFHPPRSVEEGADTPVRLATLPDDGPQGGVFRDRKPAAR